MKISEAIEIEKKNKKNAENEKLFIISSYSYFNFELFCLIVFIRLKSIKGYPLLHEVVSYNICFALACIRLSTNKNYLSETEIVKFPRMKFRKIVQLIERVP